MTWIDDKPAQKFALNYTYMSVVDPGKRKGGSKVSERGVQLNPKSPLNPPLHAYVRATIIRSLVCHMAKRLLSYSGGDNNKAGILTGIDGSSQRRNAMITFNELLSWVLDLCCIYSS